MIKISVISIVLLLLQNVYAQPKLFNLTINTPSNILPSSLYKGIKVVDSRINTANYGWYKDIGRNDRFTLKMEGSLQNALNQFMNNAAISNGADSMLMNIRNLAVDMDKDRPFIHARIELYRKLENENFVLLEKIDTSGFLEKSRLGVNHGFSNLITKIIGRNLNNAGSHDEMGFQDVIQIDSIEKLKIPLYSQVKLTDGIYKNYASFKSQIPDHQLIWASLKKGEVTKVKYKEENKSILGFGRDFYGVVYNGKPYIGTINHFVPLARGKGNEFFYSGKVVGNPNTGIVLLSSLFLGMTGGLMAAILTPDDEFEQKIDYYSGSPVLLKKIVKKKY